MECDGRIKNRLATFKYFNKLTCFKWIIPKWNLLNGNIFNNTNFWLWLLTVVIRWFYFFILGQIFWQFWHYQQKLQYLLDWLTGSCLLYRHYSKLFNSHWESIREEEELFGFLNSNSIFVTNLLCRFSFSTIQWMFAIGIMFQH